MKISSGGKEGTFTAVVDRLSNRGNAIIEIANDDHINLGPLDQEVVGEEIEFELKPEGGGKCLDKEYIVKDKRESKVIDKSKNSNKKYGKLESGDGGDNTSASNPENKNKLLNGDM